MGDNIKDMLDSLTETGIYAITQDTHQILYYNEKVRAVAPFIQIGMVCHEIWEGTCRNCPLIGIEGKESNHSINYNDPFGEIVDITANRMLWSGSIPAYVMTVSVHSMSILESYSELEIMQLGKAVTTIYPILVSVNLTRGTYYFMEYRNFINKGILEKGDYSDFIRSVIPYVFPDHRGMFLEKTSRQTLTNGQDVEFEFLYLGENNQYHWMSLRIVKSNNMYNSDLLVIIMCRDVDEEKKRIRTLEQRNEDMLLAVRNLYFAILSVDLDTEQMSYIRAADDFKELGIDNNHYPEVMKILADRLFHPEDRENLQRDFSLARLEEKIEREQGRFTEEYRRRIKGEWHWVACTAFFSDIKDKTRVVTIVLQDIHDAHVKREYLAKEDKKKEEENSRLMKEALNSARQASEAKSDFLSRMSHDIRTPMNAIIGMASLAENYIEDKERMRECIRKINVSSQHMMELINEVLDMSKIESGKLDLTEEKFKLSELIQNALAIVRPMAEQKQQKLTVKVINVVHENLCGDKPRLQQIFNNILSNANKYTPEKGSIRLTVEELATTIKQRGQFLFTFEDKGIGMSEEFLPHIFDPFSRADDSRISKINGSGLGMAITWNLVRMMNGDIRVKSKWGEGTTFTLTLSLRLLEEKSGLSDYLHGKKVLVVDDDKESRMNIGSILERFLMIREEAEDPLEALVMISKANRAGNPYYAIIVDKTLPGMDGIELTREIRKVPGSEESAVILCSYDCSAIAGEAQKAGVNAFMTKPLFISQAEEVFACLTNKKKETPAFQSIGCRKKFVGKRVLLVEDNELNMEIATEMLKMLEVIIETAENGSEAVDKFKNAEPGYYSLIFMDIQMPVMNGYLATTAIRRLEREDAGKIPIIAMTADAFLDDVQRALNAGMNEHISKPISKLHIQRVLEQWIS